MFMGLFGRYLPPALSEVHYDREGYPTSPPYKLGDLIFDTAFFVLMFLTLKAIKRKVGVTESDAVSCVKSVRIAHFWLCIDVFFIAQIARHVSRLQGFLTVRPEM